MRVRIARGAIGLQDAEYVARLDAFARAAIERLDLVLANLRDAVIDRQNAAADLVVRHVRIEIGVEAVIERLDQAITRQRFTRAVADHRSRRRAEVANLDTAEDRKSTRLNSSH